MHRYTATLSLVPKDHPVISDDSTSGLPPELLLRSKFGQARFTGADFMKLIGDFGIELVFSPLNRSGYYYYSNGRHVIVLSSKIPKWRREEVGWHEFAHFLQNHKNPISMRANFNPASTELIEKEANAFAAVCISGVAPVEHKHLLAKLLKG